MPAHYFDGTSYSDVFQIADASQDLKAGHYFDGSSYTTVWQPTITIDDFEHNDLPAYYNEAGSGLSRTWGAAAYEGSYGLDVQGFREVWSNPGDGLENYYDRSLGYWFETWMDPKQFGESEQYWLILGDGNTTTWDDHYEFRCISSGEFSIWRRESGTSTKIEEDDSTSVSWQTGHWYRISGIIESGQIRARLHNESGTRLENLQVNEDTTRFSSPMKHGFRASDTDRAFFDELQMNPALKA